MALGAVLSLLFAALAAALGTERLAGSVRSACGGVVWFTLYTSLLVIPLQCSAALELLGLTKRFSLAAPAAVSALLTLGLLAARRRRPSPDVAPSEPASIPPEARRNLMISAALVSVPFLFLLIDTLFGFPREWDSVEY